MYCGECEKQCEVITGHVDHDLILIKRNASKFIFNVETTGALAPEDVVQQALHVLRKKMTDLQKEVQGKIEDDLSRAEVPDLFVSFF